MFDPLARHVDQETGLEYEDIAAKLCDRPKASERNVEIERLRQLRYTKSAIRAYWQGYDACPSETLNRYALRQSEGRHGTSTSYAFCPASHYDRHQAGLDAGKATGCWGPADFLAVAQGDLNAQFSRMLDQTMYDVLKKGIGPIKFGVDLAKRDDFGVVRIDSLTS